MSTEFLIPALALVTLVAVAVFAIRARNKTRNEMHDSDHAKSALAKDGPTGRTEERR